MSVMILTVAKMSNVALKSKKIKRLILFEYFNKYENTDK